MDETSGGGGGVISETPTTKEANETQLPAVNKTTETNITEANITAANETEANITATNETVETNITIINETAEEPISNETIEENVTLANKTAIIPGVNETIEIEPTEENISIIKDVAITTTQYSAILGKPVKWKKRISIDAPYEITVEIPKQAKNVIVYKIIGGAKEELEEATGKTITEANETQLPAVNKTIGTNITEANITAANEIEQVIINETETQTVKELVNETIKEEAAGETTVDVSVNKTTEKEKKEKQTKGAEAKEKKKGKKIKITANVISEGDSGKGGIGILGFFKRIFGTLTGLVIDIEEKPDVKKVIINEDATEFEIEYETPAPVVNETNTSYGKKIVISSEVHYENILAFTNLTNEVSESEIILYKIVDNLKVPENFTAYDVNNNGLIDYIEWTVDSLSDATYNLYTKDVGNVVNVELLTCAIEYPIRYAIDKGFPVPDNINVEFGNEKKADIFRVGITDFLNKPELTEGYQIIQTHELCGKAIGLFVLKDSKLKPEELEGKTIAFSDNTPIDQAILKDVLKNKYGLNTTNISFWFEYPVSALREGRADVGLVSVSVYSDAINDKNLSLFMDVSEDYNELYGSYPVRDVLIMKNGFDSETAREVIEFLEGAYDFAYDNKRNMIKTYYSETGVDASDFFNFVDKRKGDYLDAVDSEGTESVQKTSDTAEREKKIEKSPEIADMVLDVNATGGLVG